MSEVQKNASSNKTAGIVKFSVLGGLGVFLFFVNIVPSGSGKITVINGLISWIKAHDTGILWQVLFFGIIALFLTTILSFFFKENNFLKWLHGDDNLFSKICFLLGGACAISFHFELGPSWWIHPDVGLLAWHIGYAVLLTVAICGAALTLVIEFGVLEFIGTLVEPIMRPIFRVPGSAAVDAFSSIAVSPAVGVYLTEGIYLEKGYTKREAVDIAACFSVASLGGMMTILQIGGISQYYSQYVVSMIVVLFMIAFIMIRIPPISRIPDTYVDGTSRDVSAESKLGFHGIFGRAFNNAVNKAGSTPLQDIGPRSLRAVVFGFKIASYVVAIAGFACAISMWTPIFDWLGKPFVPILNFLAVPDAAIISKSMLIGITECYLPVSIVASAGIAPAAMFFVALVGFSQIIFFTESANAMLQSKLPLGIGRILLLFVIRTVLCIPLCAIAMHKSSS